MNCWLSLKNSFAAYSSAPIWDKIKLALTVAAVSVRIATAKRTYIQRASQNKPKGAE